MRRLLAPLSRWLDRRIDARIAAATKGLRSSNSLLWSQVDRLARDRDAPFEFVLPAGAAHQPKTAEEAA